MEINLNILGLLPSLGKVLENQFIIICYFFSSRKSHHFSFISENGDENFFASSTPKHGSFYSHSKETSPAAKGGRLSMPTVPSPRRPSNFSSSKYRSQFAVRNLMVSQHGQQRCLVDRALIFSMLQSNGHTDKQTD